MGCGERKSDFRSKKKKRWTQESLHSLIQYKVEDEPISWQRLISYFLQTKDGKDHRVSDSMWDYDNCQLIICNWEDKCGLLCIGGWPFLVHSCQNACTTVLSCRLNISGSIYSLHLKYNRFLAILSQTMLNLIKFVEETRQVHWCSRAALKAPSHRRHRRHQGTSQPLYIWGPFFLSGEAASGMKESPIPRLQFNNILILVHLGLIQINLYTKSSLIFCRELTAIASTMATTRSLLWGPISSVCSQYLQGQECSWVLPMDILTLDCRCHYSWTQRGNQVYV